MILNRASNNDNTNNNRNDDILKETDNLLKYMDSKNRYT